jgi:hypothetical protein
MQHIKQAMQKLIDHGTKAKFYQGNREVFLRYFDSLEQYEALIAAGNFKKMEEIIRLNSEFRVEEFINNKD